jgi:hypothetical protein
MAGFYGAQRLVLQAILDAQGNTSAFIEDSRIAQSTRISPRATRDWFLTLDQDGYVDLALTEDGLRACVTAQGRLALGLYHPSPSQPSAPPAPDPAKHRPPAVAATGVPGAVNIPQHQRDQIFICYSRTDNQNPDFREMLVRQLKAVNLAQQGILQLEFFVDEQIKPGARWRDEIQRALSRTRVAVILEGAGLMASEFVQREEIPSFLKAAQDDAGITVFRVPVRHVSELLVPPALQGIQAAWPLNAPLSGLSGSKRDAALAEIVAKIVKAYAN